MLGVDPTCHGHWSNRYLGLAYAPNGRGPEAYDCWQFARMVLQRHFGVPLPDLATALVDGADLRRVLRGWRRTQDRQDGLGVVMGAPGRLHVGVWVNGGVLHCLEGIGVVHSREAGLRSAGLLPLRCYRYRGAR